MAPDGEAPKGAGGAGQGAPPGAREGSQDLRQALVQEAVAFMAHPRVRDAGAGIKRMLLLGEGLTVPEVDEAFDRIRAFGAALIPPKPLGAAAVRSHVSETASAIAASAQLHGGRPHLSAPQPRDAGAHREDDGWAQTSMGLGVAAAGVLALGQALELLWPAAKARTAGLGQSVQKLQRDTKAAVEDVQAICADVKNRTGAIEETFKGVERDVQALAGRLERILSDQEPRKESDRLCEPIQMSLLPSLAPQQEHGELDSVEVPDADLFDK